MKRLAIVAALGGVLVACGNAGSRTVNLRPANPRLADIYLQVRGPSGVAKAMTDELRRASALIVASAAHGRRDCSGTKRIGAGAGTSADLRKFVGQRYTISIYGSGASARVLCRRLGLFGEGTDTFKIPSAAMEPTLHCAKPAPGCLGRGDDLAVTRLTGATHVERRDILVFKAPGETALKCGEGGIFVKRVIGLPGETVREDDHGFIWIRLPGSSKFVKLKEPYIPAQSRLADTNHFGERWQVTRGSYFVIGDNRSASCDSRTWGSVPARNVIGRVVQIIRGGRRLRPAGIPQDR